MTSDHAASYVCYRRGCRREDCRTADRNYRKQYELRCLRGIPSHIPGPTVAAHLRHIIDSGRQIRSIATESGVSERAIGYILRGQPKVTRPKALALLAVQPLTEAPRIDPTGTIRRIQALAAIGWPVTWTADQAGSSVSYTFKILGGRVPAIPRDVAARFAALYRQQSYRRGPSEHTRSIARRNGWHGPLAWDNIDDPAEQPETEQNTRTLNFHERAALRREEIEHLAWCGHQPEQIHDRMGGEVSLSTIRQIVHEWRTGAKRDRKQVAA